MYVGLATGVSLHHVCFRQGADSVHLKRAKFAHDQGPSLGVEYTSGAVFDLTDKHATGRHRVENLHGRATHTTTKLRFSKTGPDILFIQAKG